MFKADFPIKRIILLLPLLALLSCTQGRLDPFDHQVGLTRGETKDSLVKSIAQERKKKQKIQKTKQADIPQISQMIIAPPPPKIGGDKTISFSVTDAVSLKDVLIELGRVAKIDVDIDPNIDGGIIISARNKPLKEVIDRIATLGNLRYSYENDVLHFTRDTPYMKNYFVDYLVEGSVWTDVETNITAVLSSESSGADSGSATFSSNKSAGIISIYANQKQHDATEKYLEDVRKTVSAQVLIEAKVVEVALTEEFNAGIDWTASKNGKTISSSNGFTSGSQGIVTQLSGGLFTNYDLTTNVSALETFGTTKTLSSPRIHAMNNQKATLNFADKLVYFQIENDQSLSGTGTSNVVATTTTATIQEEDVGLELSITPSIDIKTGEITLGIEPKLSSQSDTVTDPTNSANTVPVIQTRQISTTAKIQSGNVVVIGGLMKQNGTNTDSGIPFLSRIPVLGWLFKSTSKNSTVTETVIFVKATIVKSSTPPSKVDRELQEKFDANRREFF